VSLVDLFPTILDCVGAEVGPEDRGLLGRTLFDVMGGDATNRTVFCEYHAAGALTGAFMIRRQQFKAYALRGDAPDAVRSRT
jgi:choline-sulfatase